MTTHALPAHLHRSPSSDGKPSRHSEDEIAASVLLIAGALVDRGVFPSAKHIRDAGCLVRDTARINQVRRRLESTSVLVVPAPWVIRGRARKSAIGAGAGTKPIHLWRGGTGETVLAVVASGPSLAVVGGAGEGVPPTGEAEVAATRRPRGPVGPLAGTIRELRALERRRKGLLGAAGTKGVRT